MLRAYHHRYGLNYVGLRYMNVYGPRQDYRGAYIAVIMKMLDDIDKGDLNCPEMTAKLVCTLETAIV